MQERATAGGDVELPGVDTHDMTPRERHEFSRYVDVYKRQTFYQVMTIAAPESPRGVLRARVVFRSGDCRPIPRIFERAGCTRRRS